MHALTTAQAATLTDRLGVAIIALREALDAAGECGPILAATYTVLGRALDLRELIDRTPTMTEESSDEPTTRNA